MTSKCAKTWKFSHQPVNNIVYNMSDKSFGDCPSRNIVKNPLLSTAVTGLSIEDLTHNAVLVPVAATQGLITRSGEYYYLFLSYLYASNTFCMTLCGERSQNNRHSFSRSQCHNSRFSREFLAINRFSVLVIVLNGPWVQFIAKKTVKSV